MHAPVGTVFAMFSEAHFLEQWFFPPRVTIIRSELTFSEGGSYLFGMAVPDRTPVWGRLDFEQLDRPRSLTFVQSVTDEHGSTIPPLAGSKWLLRLRSKISLHPRGRGSVLRQTVSADQASSDEVSFVDATWHLLAEQYDAALTRLSSIFDQRTH